MVDEIIYLPPFPTPTKPRKWQPCNGCGWCCHMELCRIGQNLYPETPAPCPAIVYEDGKVRCGIVLAEIEMERDGKEPPPIREMLGVGHGCCADDLE